MAGTRPPSARFHQVRETTEVVQERSLIVCLYFSLQFENIQQSGIRRSSVTVRLAGIRGGLSADEDVYDSDVLCEGLGR